MWADTASNTVFVDSKPYMSGTGFKLYHLVDGPDTLYYSCSSCSGNSGFFKGAQILATAAEMTGENSSFFANLVAGGCLFDPNVNVHTMLAQAKAYSTKENGVFVGCSPNGKHFISSTPHPIFPEGSNNTIKVDDQWVDDGNIENPYVNDMGQASYLNSNGAGQGHLVLEGKKYSFKGDTDNNPLFSPSQDHVALGLGGEWWVDGYDTHFSDNGTVSLSDTAFYAYTIQN
jgi:hypothetical protein